MTKYQIGDIVKLDENAEGYDLIVEETGITSECVGLIISYTKPGYTNGGKPIEYNGWYSVLFNGFEPFDFEDWEISPLCSNIK